MGSESRGGDVQQPKSGLAKIELDGLTDPMDLYQCWLNQAQKHGAARPNVFSMATVSKCGDLTNRMMTVKDIKDKCFVFLSNGNSPKFDAIRENPVASITFFWNYKNEEKQHVYMQVRVDGHVEKLSREETEKYFASQPLFCQIRSIICDQSKKVDWEELKKKHDKALKTAEEGQTFCAPEYEVAYRIKPLQFDFYYSYDNFIADRLICAASSPDCWSFERVMA